MEQKKKELYKVAAERPKVTVSSCLCDQIGVQGYNKAGVEREAANQGRDGLVPARLKKKRKKKKNQSGKVNNSYFFFFSLNPLHININTTDS